MKKVVKQNESKYETRTTNAVQIIIIIIHSFFIHSRMKTKLLDKMNLKLKQEQRMQYKLGSFIWWNASPGSNPMKDI